MIDAHTNYRTLCALAALGDISSDERSQLDEHLTGCASCRTAFAEFAQVIGSELPLAHDTKRHWYEAVWDMLLRGHHRRRFVQSVAQHGIYLEEQPVPTPGLAARIPSLPIFAVGICTVLLATTTVLFLRMHHELEHAQIIAGQSPAPAPVDNTVWESQLADVRNKVMNLEGALSTSRQVEATAASRAAFMEQKLHDKSAELDAFHSNLEAQEAREGVERGKLSDQEHHLTELQDEIQGLKTSHVADEVQLAVEHNHAQELEQKLKAQTDMLGQEEQLLAAGREVRDLMGARNLHIVDVFDTDIKGGNRRAFGRVFYTEGKSLLFYAFDLSPKGPVMDAKHSFQAWGERFGEGTQAVNLGIFYVDDKAQKRWALKVENPELLAQIDSVFVTVEPPGGGEKPSGQRLLYAYLSTKPNHP